jgi:G3E family GTPase
VVTVADADAMVRFPQLGQTARTQIEAADIILLNKIDLVSAEALTALQDQLAHLNEAAAILPTQRCRIDPDLLFGLARTHELNPPTHVHQPGVESFSYVSEAILDRDRFEQCVGHLSPAVVRAKGFVRCAEGTYLFNYIAGRWDLEPFPEKPTSLVFIGPQVTAHKANILNALKQCER